MIAFKSERPFQNRHFLESKKERKPLVSTRTLLLADDSVTIQKVVNLTFADEGIEVISVGDGDSAMQKFAESQPDLVLADVNMPGLNGYQICEQIRGTEATKDIPVILLVGSFEPFDESEAKRVGANDYLTKPFQSIRQLVNKVTDLIEAKPGAAAAANGDGEEPDDIQSLYQKSFEETAELPQAAAAATELGDSGLDDEMIEASYLTPPIDESEGVAAAEAIQQPADEDDFGGAFDSEQLEIQEETVETYDVGSDAVLETEPVLSEVAGEYVTETRFDAPIAAELHETPPQPDFRPEAPFDSVPSYDEVPSPQEESLIVSENASVQEAEPDFRIDDSNLLELPSSGGPTGFVMTPSVAAAEPEPEQHPDLSPEFIEAVAQKVLERISDVAVREIAWRVVPQIVESVVREKTENKHGY